MTYNFIEVGHFYSDETNSEIKLDYLTPLKETLRQMNTSVKALFIDDYTNNTKNLNITALRDEVERIIDSDIKIFYEGDMVQYFDQTISLFTDNDLVITKYNRGKTEKLELAINDYRITLAEVHPNFQPTCAMLSLIWTLYRLGAYSGVSDINPILTIIDSKYEPVENKVMKMVHYLQKQNGVVYTPSLNYWFY